MSQETMSPQMLVADLVSRAEKLGPKVANDLLKRHGVETAAAVIARLNAVVAEPLLSGFSAEYREQIFAHLPEDVVKQWRRNLSFPEASVGRLMETPHAVFLPQTTARDTIEKLRDLVKQAFITYVYVADEEGRLEGLVVMRELMLARPEQTLADIMITQPFCLSPELPQIEAMRTVLKRHFPVYPICDDDGKLIGLIRGAMLFEKQAVELTAQAGTMVGVEKEERLATPWPRSLKFRQPWLQVNLLTGFIAAAVVGMFQDTIDHVVVLAAFIPVMVGQAANTGCQSMAISLRGLTLGEVKSGNYRRIIIKEALLGLLNGILTGITAGVGMYFYALYTHNPEAYTLAAVVVFAMTGSCLISGIVGVTVPLILKRLGFDPATASSIFLTTITDVVSVGSLLWLAYMMVEY